MFRELSVFAGDFGLAAAAGVCCGGDEAAALDVVDRLAAKSLAVAETAAGGTRYRLLETIRQYAAGRLAEAGEDRQARRRHASVFLDLAERERELAVLARDHDNLRAALDWSLVQDSETGLRLARALGDFWLARGFLQEARGWLERALAAGSPDGRLRADLLRLLGAVLYQAGDLRQAEVILSEGPRTAAAAGERSAQARIGVLLAEIHRIQGEPVQDALAGCEAAVALLESEGDLAGLAGAWLSVGILGVLLGDAPGGARGLERAAAYARQSGNHHAEAEAHSWLVVSFQALPIPADAAIGRAEQLLEAASGDPWAEATIIQPLSLLYGFAGRFADARAAIARSQAIFIRSGSALNWSICVMLAGHIEMIAGNPAAAERALTDGCQALPEMPGGYLASILAWLAEAVYAQDRLGEAQQLTEQAQIAAADDDLDAQTRWRATRAKLLARHGEFAAARRLAGEAVALVAATSHASELAAMLVASAEVSRLAGAREEAEASLRKALRIYQDRGAIPLADRTRAALASLAARPGTGPG